MNPVLTEEEFYHAFTNTTHHAPPGYWDAVHAERKTHKDVGREAIDLQGPRKAVIVCYEADDDRLYFYYKDTPQTTLILNRKNEHLVKWRAI